MEFQYEYQDTPHKLALQPTGEGQFKATIGDREIEFFATQQTDGAWLLTLNHRRILAYVTADDERRYVHVNGKSFTLTAVDERVRRRKQAGAVGDLTAQMPGQVVDVLVSEGQQITSGQTLVILEAMKMEIRVTAPADGMVRGVFVSKGDVVERGQRLIEVAPP